MRFFRESILLIALVAIAATGCSGKAAKPDRNATASPPEIGVGTARWTGGALLLPADAPAVLEARPGALLDGLRRFKDWIVAEPAMLGEDGEATVTAIEVGWAQMSNYLAVDPLDPSTWRERGIDVDRPVYIAPHALGDVGRDFVVAVERQIRDELGVPPRGDVREALLTLRDTAGELPEGANARVLRAVEHLRPMGALRVVIPITTSIDFMRTVRSLADGAGFEQFTPQLAAGLGLSPLEAAFWSSSGPIPAIAVRAQGSHAVIDLLWPALVGASPVVTSDPAADLEAVHAQLRQALHAAPAGRPRAPRAPGRPTLALSFDQVRAAQYVKLRGFRQTLTAVRAAGADTRDERLFDGLLLAMHEAACWLVGASVLPGIAYAFDIGSPTGDAIGRASLTMFGRAAPPSVPPVPRYPSLGIENRSAAIGFTFETTRTVGWSTWFANEVARDLAFVDPEDLSGARLAVPMARVAALAFATLGDRERIDELFPDATDAFKGLQEVRRLEFAGLKTDMRSFRLNPGFLVAAVLEPGPDVLGRATATRDDVVQAFHELLETEQTPLNLDPVVADTTQPLMIDELPTHSRLVTTGDVPYLVVGYGLDAAAFEAEVRAMETRQSAPEIFSMRLEPIMLLSLLRLEDANPLEPLDLDILAQRLGPLVLDFGPETVGEASTVTFEAILRDPPEL